MTRIITFLWFTLACAFAVLLINGCKKASNEEDLAMYSRLVKEHPDASWLYRERGKIYFHMSKGKMALNDFNRAIELGDKSAGSYRMRAELLMAVGRYDPAILDLTHAIELGGDHAGGLPFLFNLRGKCHNGLCQYQAAIWDYLESIRTDTHRVNLTYAYSLPGCCYVMTGQNDSAIWAYEMQVDQIRKAARLFEGVDQFYNDLQGELAELYWLKGDYEKSLSYVNNDIQIAKQPDKYYYFRGIINYEMGNEDAAIEDLEKAVSVNEKLGSAALKRPYYEYFLSAAFAKTGQLEESLKHLSLAVEKGFYFFDLVDENTDLANLRRQAGYRKLIAADGTHERIAATMQKFRAIIRGDISANPQSPEAQIVGDRYLSIFFRRDKAGEFRRLNQVIDEEVFARDGSALADSN